MDTDWETVIGLEVHAQLSTRTKIFCGCSTQFGMEPNTAVCPVCLGYPGVLPVMNEAVLDLAVKACLLLQMEVQAVSKMDRKNYFYPDLPKGYQISQYDRPIGTRGRIRIIRDGESVDLEITRAHMEEDAGKLMHGENGSLVDFNRTGVPLLEIVSEPVIPSPEEAVLYLKKLKQILKYGAISDCNMEEGSLRCDANISLRPRGQTTLGTKTEIKNLNSFKYVQKALEYEITRQARILDEGGRVTQETRLYDVAAGKTRSMRSKEEAHDYRYFPEPDLVPFHLTEAAVAALRADLPETPDARLTRFQTDFALPLYDASVLTAERETADFFEATLKTCANAKLVSNWMMSEVMREWNDRGLSADRSPVKADGFGALLNAIQSGKINGKIAKELLPAMFATGRPAEDLIAEKGLAVISDADALREVIHKVIRENDKTVADFRSGKGKAVGFLVGQVMKATQGKADPAMVNSLLKEALS